MHYPLSFLTPKFQASSLFCGCTARFVSDLVGNPEDRISRDAAQIYFTILMFLLIARHFTAMDSTDPGPCVFIGLK